MLGGGRADYWQAIVRTSSTKLEQPPDSWVSLSVEQVTRGGLAACSDSTTEPEEPLTEAEAIALLQGIRGIMGDSILIAGTVTQSGAAVECPLGGQVAATIDVTLEPRGDTVRVVMEATLTPSGCRFTSRGLEFTVDGNPNVHIRGVITSLGLDEEIGVENHTTGVVDWELDDRSGTCVIDMELDAILDLSGSEPNGTGTDTGMMCGMTIELTTEDMSVGG